MRKLSAGLAMMALAIVILSLVMAGGKNRERVRIESPYQLSQPLFFSDSLSGMEIEILDKFQEGVIRVTVTIPTSWDEEAQEPILEEFRFFCSSYSAQMSGEFRNWNPK